MYLPGVRPSAAWMDIAVVLVVVVLSVALLGWVGRLVLDLLGELDERVVQAALIPVQGLLFGGIVAAVLRFRGQSAKSVALTASRLGVNIALGLAAVAAGFVTFYLCLCALLVIEPLMWEVMGDNADRITLMLPRMHPVFLVALMGVVGFYEELVFRGFLLTRLRRASGSWVIAVAVSSVLFAVPHAVEQQPAAVLPLFGLAVVFSLFTIWRKSLIPAMIGHALFNSAQLVWIYYQHPNWT
jgi:membrane protease YdiL (CAAX protease family)